MKSSIALILVAVLLAGCETAQTNFAYKRGMSLAQKARDVDTCEFAAVKEIPAAMAVSVTPGFSSPGTLSCSTFNGITNCQTIGAVNIPGSVDSYDRNRPVRDRFMLRCMANKGYTFHPKPACRTDEETAAAVTAINKGAKAEDIPCAPRRRSLNG